MDRIETKVVYLGYEPKLFLKLGDGWVGIDPKVMSVQILNIQAVQGLTVKVKLHGKIEQDSVFSVIDNYGKYYLAYNGTPLENCYDTHLSQTAEDGDLAFFVGTFYCSFDRESAINLIDNLDNG